MVLLFIWFEDTSKEAGFIFMIRFLQEAPYLKKIKLCHSIAFLHYIEPQNNKNPVPPLLMLFLDGPEKRAYTH